MYQLAMVLSRIPVIVLLLIFIQNVTRIEGSSGNKDYIGENIISGSGQSTFSNESTNDMISDSNCDTYRNYFDDRFLHELGNLTNNGLINITTDAMLLSIVPLVDLENILIIGHDNPTVNCDNVGGIHFDNCHNYRYHMEEVWY